jgi:hypothetical protein
MTIGERREELTRLPLKKLRRLFRRVERDYSGNTAWADGRKRADMVQAIINFEVGGGSTS